MKKNDLHPIYWALLFILFLCSGAIFMLSEKILIVEKFGLLCALLLYMLVKLDKS